MGRRSRSVGPPSGSSPFISTLARAKPNCVFVGRNVNFDESGILESSRQTIGANGYVNVANVKFPKFVRGEAVLSSQDSTRAKQSVEFRKQCVLEIGPRDVMKHRQAHRSAESIAGQVRRRSISAYHVNIGATEALTKGGGEFWMDLDRREPSGRLPENVRRESGSRSDFEYVVP